MVRHGASALFSSQIRRGLAASSTFAPKPKPLVEPVQHKTSLSSVDLQANWIAERMKPQTVASAVRHRSTVAQQRRVSWADNSDFLLGYLNLMIAFSAIVVVSIVALRIYVAQNMSEMQQPMSEMQQRMSEMRRAIEHKEK
uniref:Transmembrane protein n=1 Tax=Globodera pallida TaxID=36090 RepID=A0A183CJN6_GLOPA